MEPCIVSTLYIFFEKRLFWQKIFKLILSRTVQKSRLWESITLNQLIVKQWIHALYYTFVLILGHDMKVISQSFFWLYAWHSNKVFVLEHKSEVISQRFRESSWLVLHKNFRPRASKKSKQFYQVLWIHALHYVFVCVLGHETKAFLKVVLTFHDWHFTKVSVLGHQHKANCSSKQGYSLFCIT